MQSLVEKYRPRKIADFVGIAEPKAAMGALARSPYASAWLLTGAPGLGKTTIAQALFEMIGGQQQHIPARMCDLETVQRVTESCNYVPLMGGFNLVLCDEIDKASMPAQSAWLSTLDSTRMPPDTIFVFTSNNLEKLEERFVSRCRHLEFTAPNDEDLRLFLARVWASETRASSPDLAAIVEKAKGNVRNALMLLEVKLLTAVVVEEPAAVVDDWMARRAAAMDTPKAPPAAAKVVQHLAKTADGKWMKFDPGASCPCEKCQKARVAA